MTPARIDLGKISANAPRYSRCSGGPASFRQPPAPLPQLGEAVVAEFDPLANDAVVGLGRLGL
jgi:hypothetical protein